WSGREQVGEVESSRGVLASCSEGVLRIGYARNAIPKHAAHVVRPTLLLQLTWVMAEGRPDPFYDPIHLDRNWWENGEGYWAISVQVWLAIVLLAILPTFRTWCLLREKRSVLEGYCLGCGYDLRASKERCPECGTAIVAE